MRPVQLNPAALLDTQKAVTQFIQRPLAPTGQKKSVAVLRCSRGFYSDQVPHLGNNLHRVQNVAGLHFQDISLAPVSTLYPRRRKQLLVKTKQTNKKTTENVVMINGRSNDGH